MAERVDRPHQRVYRGVFVKANGNPPYTCFFCGDSMKELEHVHHFDEDPRNNEPDNLFAAHAFCHNSTHHKGMQHTQETKERISATLREKISRLTIEERKEKHGLPGKKNPFYGKRHTEESLEKIQKAAKAREAARAEAGKKRAPCTEETREKLREAMNKVPRLWCEECKADWPPGIWKRHIRKYHEGGVW